MGERRRWQEPVLDPQVRRAFLELRRQSQRRRYDEQYSSTYDRDWGAISPTHASFVRRLLALTRPGGTILDVPCGTGKYWPLVLDSGRTLVGIDQSRGMLGVAAAKHPDVPVGEMELKALRFDAVFDGVLCIDAMENVGPEDWAEVLARLRAAARPGTCLYVTSEILGEDEVRRDYEAARDRGDPVVPGESFDGIGYHYYPEREAIRAWFEEAGLQRIEEAEADGYAHFLLRRSLGE